MRRALPTNIEGMVGVGSWGPVNAAIIATNEGDTAGKLGTPQVRAYDIATHVAAACQMGNAINFRLVRVTDGTDTAATAQVQTTGGQATALYTGSLGNKIAISFANTGRLGAYAAIIQGVTGLPERFDNIFTGLASVTVAPGTGYTYVPSAQVSAPQIVGGVPATVRPTLTSITQALGTGGTGHVVNDVVTFGAGVQVKVLTVASGAIATFQVLNPGSITSGAVPGTVGNQTSTTGAGTGATLTLTWGLGQPQISYGSGYYNAMSAALTLTLSGGGAGGGFTAGSYTPVVSFWAALATAINNGTPNRGRSASIVFTPGSSTAVPTVNVVTALSGGTDGAGGVTTQQLVGVDGLGNARTGMYALRGTGIDGFELCDCTDTAPWGAMLQLGIQEAAYPMAAAPQGTSIAATVALRQSAGIDDPQFKLFVGDYPYFYDSYYGTRAVSPCAIALGLFGNLSPEQGTINKPLIAVTATDTSMQGVFTSSADLAVAELGGVELIGRSTDLGEDYFSLLTGRNTSSNTIARGDEYTRLTNYFIKTFEQVGKSFVGKLQSQRATDPTRTQALQTFDSYCQSQVDPSSGSDGYGKIDAFLNTCRGPNEPGTENTAATIQGGYLFLTSRLEYLNVVRYFVVNLFGGGNVSVTVSANLPTQSA